ncbi:nitrite reductase [Streptomyces sp. NPDC002187]|uniref:nitrite reductase n=1 Tax=Streptomyces sp. NPDC002187 TaxID=3364637 RepID=UPI0036A8D1DD
MPSAPSNRPDLGETPIRDRGDACPGALRLHTADDGALARVRIPAGVLSAAQAYTLADAAERLGDGGLDITSRGNLQLRGLDASCGGELAVLLDGAGLLPAPRHERIRNVVASPLSGLDEAGHLDVQPLVRQLDLLLCASERAAQLSGRFLFALDDGRGDLAGLGADVMLLAEPDGSHVRVTVGEAGLRVRAEDGARALLLAAEAFLDAVDASGTRAWRVRELPPEHAVEADDLARRAAAAGIAARPATGGGADPARGGGSGTTAGAGAQHGGTTDAACADGGDRSEAGADGGNRSGAGRGNRSQAVVDGGDLSEAGADGDNRSEAVADGGNRSGAGRGNRSQAVVDGGDPSEAGADGDNRSEAGADGGDPARAVAVGAALPAAGGADPGVAAPVTVPEDSAGQKAPGVTGVGGRASATGPGVPAVPVPVPGLVRRGRHTVALSVLAPLGRLTVAQWRMLADTADRYGTGELRVTPWRGVVVPGLGSPDADRELRALAGAGLVTAADSPWLGTGACTGRPGCAKSLADVRADATAFVAAGAGGLPVYWSGCERRCGHPHGVWVDAVATGDGYDISVRGTRSPERRTVPVSRLADALEAARRIPSDDSHRPTK